MYNGNGERNRQTITPIIIFIRYFLGCFDIFCSFTALRKTQSDSNNTFTSGTFQTIALLLRLSTSPITVTSLELLTTTPLLLLSPRRVPLPPFPPTIR